MPSSHLPAKPSDSASATTAPAPPPQVFSWIRRPETGGSIRLLLAGELDLAARSIFETALDGAQNDSDRVILDLRPLELIDCAAFFALFTAAERSRREGAALILQGPRGQVRRVLDLIGMPAGVVVMGQEDLPARGSDVAA